MTRSRPKVPRTPPSTLTRTDEDVLLLAPVLWRIHRTTGEHVGRWDALRTFGPIPSMRYDPHPAPMAEHGPGGEGVLYAAADIPDGTDGTAGPDDSVQPQVGLATALAEVYQDCRMIDTLSGTTHATSWTPTRPLRLLNLSGGWALRNEAAFALTTGRKDVSRAWARAIRETWPDLDGLWSPSTLTGGPNVALWNPSRDSFPTAPALSRPLRHSLVIDLIEKIARDEINYSVLR